MTDKRVNSMHLPRVILIDLDDTIVDDTGSLRQCWVEVCEQAAANLNGVTPDQLFAAVDARRDWFWSDPARHREGRLQLRETTVRIVQVALADLGFESPALARDIGESYHDLRDERLALFPGAIETLAALQRQGVRLAMLTNGAAKPQRAKIQRFDIERYFDCIVVEGEFGAGKPDPRVYEYALDTLGVRPEEAWCIGDNLDWDVGAPMKLGVYGIWHDPLKTGLPADSTVKPDRIVHSLSELVAD
ncbi:MAG: HAD family hydrolase [Chloroflexi bacterium]|nr:HAD family hydrolase [Chloroflexota bacterium]